MTAGRPIGERIRKLCETLERKGPKGIAELRGLMPDIERSNLWKYCTRGVGLGLITVNRETGHSVFTVSNGWREMADQRRTTKLQTPKPVVRATRWTGVSSVFQMGAM